MKLGPAVDSQIHDEKECDLKCQAFLVDNEDSKKERVNKLNMNNLYLSRDFI